MPLDQAKRVTAIPFLSASMYVSHFKGEVACEVACLRFMGFRPYARWRLGAKGARRCRAQSKEALAREHHLGSDHGAIRMPHPCLSVVSDLGDKLRVGS